MESDHSWIMHYIRMLGDELMKLVEEGKALEVRRGQKNKELSRLKNDLFRVDIEISEVQDELKVHSNYKIFIELVVKLGHYKKYQKAKEDIRQNANLNKDTTYSITVDSTKRLGSDPRKKNKQSESEDKVCFYFKKPKIRQE